MKRMKLYIFRDIYTGKLYKVHDDSSAHAKYRVATQKNIKLCNLARVKTQEKVNA